MPSDPEGSAPAIITAHAFAPRREWWTTCRVCGIAEAAHAETEVTGLCEACGDPCEADQALCATCEWTERPA
jgi:hypothetical protein